MKTAFLLLLANCIQWVDLRSMFPENIELTAVRAVDLILKRHSSCEYVTLLLKDGDKEMEMERMQAPRGVAVFQMAVNYLNDNTTKFGLMVAVDNVRQMGQLWHCLVLVVDSDDPTFLAAFAHLSLRRHALPWSTRILVLTRLPLSELGGLHDLLSTRNAMLLLSQEDKETISRVNVYVWLPYSSSPKTPLRVATWTLHETRALASNLSLFPDKFSIFTTGPTLTVAIEVLPHNTLSWVEDSDAPGGRRLMFSGYVDNIVKYFSKAMNFTVRYVLSAERTFGTKLPDGSWTGMMGLVVRQEADFATGPFILNPVRKEAADHTIPFYNGHLRILSGLTGLEIDPWSFLLPLTPFVWVVTITALLGMFAVLQLLPYCLPGRTQGCDISSNSFACVRVILQQDVVLPIEWWWWERLVLGAWMLTTMVLTKSYSGNLMSLLAVRYVPQPFQTLRDVLDNPHVVMIWQKYSGYEQYLRAVKTGIFREVAEREAEGRLRFHTQAEYLTILDSLVRAGHSVLVDADISLRSLAALDFTRQGRCDFYISRDGFLPFSAAMMTQKTNPLIQGFNDRLLTVTEQGLITHWMENVPNFTECEHVPRKILVISQIAASNNWGMFVVLAVGQTAAMVVWCAEVFISPAKQHQLPPAPSLAPF